MVEDITKDFLNHRRAKIADANRLLSQLRKDFGTATVSAAIGEISEKLVASYTSSTPSKRNTRGHDLIDKKKKRIEVKGRVIGEYGDRLQFNFRTHTKNANSAYMLAWSAEGKIVPKYVFRASVSDLLKNWSKNNKFYCARTTLGKVKRAAKVL